MEIMAGVPTLLLGDGKPLTCNWLSAGVEVVARVARFWGRINVACDSRFDGRDTVDEDIISGSSALLALLLAAVNEV